LVIWLEEPVLSEHVRCVLKKLTKRPEYGTSFVLRPWYTDRYGTVHILLVIRFLQDWYPITVDLSNYPFFVRGWFSRIPPCPTHPTYAHPDFLRAIINSDIESSWQRGASLFEDYIKRIYDRLNHPTQHLSCEQSMRDSCEKQ
jgi:hypothetical protein